MRLTKIYTRSGDKGNTRLANGEEVSKDSLRVTAYGEVDELNCLIGLLASQPLSQPLQDSLNTIQHDLFDLGSDLSLPGRGRFSSRYTEWLEQQLDQLNAELPPLTEFILPAGPPAAAHCHHARAVCRRAERRMVTLLPLEETVAPLMQYLNRLSDLLFVMARTIARAEGEERLWRPGSRGKRI